MVCGSGFKEVAIYNKRKLQVGSLRYIGLLYGFYKDIDLLYGSYNNGNYPPENVLDTSP